jgi:hypothetical protein
MRHPEQSDTIQIRGHSLLCLQGFQGEGYNQEFVANMARIHELLKQHADTPVQVTAEPDQICAACPNLSSSGCSLRRPGFEEEITAQDRKVIQLMGLRPGQTLTWHEVLDRIGHNIRGEMLPDICGSCLWLPLGHCREGIDRLRAAKKSLHAAKKA